MWICLFAPMQVTRCGAEEIVTWKRFVFVSGLVACLLVLALHASAQSGPNCTSEFQICAFCGESVHSGGDMLYGDYNSFYLYGAVTRMSRSGCPIRGVP